MVETAAGGLTADFTVELWIEVRDPANMRGIFVDARSPALLGGWVFYADLDSGVLLFRYFGADGSYNGHDGPAIETLTPGWHHVAATRENGNGALFIDGAVYGTFTLEPDPSTEASRIAIGGSVNGAPEWYLPDASVDDVRVSNRALYWRPFEPRAGLVVEAYTQLLWRFDEGEGDTTRDDVGSVDLFLDEVNWVSGI